ncbi:MAG: GNAT family N-acetyltransferase [bacterium]|nr:GNAT family N-acetyltransferase [bacterium]
MIRFLRFLVIANNSGPLKMMTCPPDTWEVFACNVHPSHWRRGFGSDLMTAMLSRLNREGAKMCTLWVLEGNLRAREFYGSLGFSEDASTRIEAANTRYPLSELRYARAIRAA